MPENEPIRRYEFDLYRGEMDRRVTRVERDLERAVAEHDAYVEQQVREQTERAKEARDHRRWSWQQVVAVLAVAATVCGLWLDATAGR